MVLVCHVISQDDVIKESGDFTGKLSSRKVTILQKLVALTTTAVEISFF